MSADLRHLIAGARVALDDLAREALFFVGGETGIGGETTRAEVRDAAAALDAALEATTRIALLETAASLPDCIRCDEHMTRLTGVRRAAQDLDRLRGSVRAIIEQIERTRFRRRARRLRVAELLVHLAVELRRVDRQVAALWATTEPAPDSSRRRRAAA